MDALGYVTHLIAYDRFYFRRNKSVRKWWKKYWKAGDNDYTVKGIREALLDKYGFRYEDVTLMNDSRIVYEPAEFKQITFGELLTQMCAINARIPHIDETGEVKFIQLGETVAHVLTSSDIETENCEFEYYDTPVIDGVSVENTEMVISSDEDDDDDADNIFAFPYNVFFEGKKEKSMKNRAIELYEAIDHITYRPCYIKMIQSDYDIKLGDRVRVTAYRNGQAVTYNTYVFKNSFSGPLLIEQTFGCDGESEYTVSTGSGLASKVNASEEIVTTTVNITVEAAVDDTITISDEDGTELMQVTFALGESSAVIPVTIPVGGQILVFESEGFAVTLEQFVNQDCTVTLEPAIFAYYYLGINSRKMLYTRNPSGALSETSEAPTACDVATYAFGHIYANQKSGTYLYVSPDKGQTWSQVQDVVANSIQDVKFLDNKLVVCTKYSRYDTAIYLATNGTTWSRISASISFTPRGIAYNGTGTWVMVGEVLGGSNYGYIAYTTNPLNWDDWTEVTVSRKVKGVEWCDGFFIAWGDGGKIYKSIGGDTWNEFSVASETNPVASLAHDDNGVLVCTCNGKAYRSTDSGSTWFDYTPQNVALGQVVYGNNRFVANGSDGNGFALYYSGDGLQWSQGTALPSGTTAYYISYVGE